MTAQHQQRLQTAARQHGGLIWAIDALQPESSDPPLYVLYEVLSNTPISALQESNPTAERLHAWLQPYTHLPFAVLATLSDGEKAVVAALKAGWPGRGHQRCQLHFLNNVAKPAMEVDARLRSHLRDELGALAAVPNAGSSAPQKSTDEAALPPFVAMQRDAGLIAIEQQVRCAIRDALNRSSRKPFTWGGLAGYDQLDTIAQALHRLPLDAETAYLRSLIPQVDRALEVNRPLCDDVRAAHSELRRIAECLHYPPDATPAPAVPTTSHMISQEMEALLAQFRPDPKQQVAQAALQCAWHRLWKAWADDLLTCYDIPGLPADNLQLESFFNHIRQHERRISGRASTGPLGVLGAYQVLFIADSEQDLLDHLGCVPLVDYQAHRQRVAQCETTRHQRYRFHHDPRQAIAALLDQHATRRAALSATQRPGAALM